MVRLRPALLYAGLNWLPLCVDRVLALASLSCLYRRATTSLAQAQSSSFSSQANNSERTVVLLYHKPAGTVVTHAIDDVQGRTNVYEDVQSMQGFMQNTCSVGGDDDAGNIIHEGQTNSPDSFATVTKICSKLHAIGRLDAETNGVLLLTNDGGLVHHVTNKNKNNGDHHHQLATSSTHHLHTSRDVLIYKTYRALIMGRHTQDSVLVQTLLKDGVDIGAKYGGHTLPVDSLQVLETYKSTTLVEVTIHEGKNRQVRRMFHALGSGVMQLTRTRMHHNHHSQDGDAQRDHHHLNRDETDDTPLTINSVPEPGQWRILTEAQVVSALQWESREIMSPKIATSGVSSSPGPRRRRHQRSTKRKSKRRR